jgi:hypothetical protein
MPPDGSVISRQRDSLLPAMSTSATFAMSAQPTSRAMRNAISSPVSDSGPAPCVLPDGLTAARSGRHPARASLSARQAKAMGLLTSGTCGRPSTGSSASIALASSLANRLRARAASSGSTLYRLTWKQAATPAGRLFFRLAASVLRTSDNGCGGWPTPVAIDATSNNESRESRLRRGSSGSVNLPTAAALAGWPTPKAEDAESTGFSAKRLEAGKTPDNLHSATKLLVAGWASPKESDHRPGHHTRMLDTSRINLNDQAMQAGWATPAERDYRTPNHKAWSDRGGGKKGEQLNNQVAHFIPGASLNGLAAPTPGAGLLNPDFSRWLQGIPATWASCAPTATRSIRNSAPK